MDGPVGAARIVRPDLVYALFFERHLHAPAVRREAHDGFLMAGEQGVPLAQHGVRQRPLLPDGGEYQFQRRFLVGQQALDRGIVHPLESMDAADLFQAFGHQLYGDAPPERVEPLDLPGLDGELPGAVRGGGYPARSDPSPGA